MPAGSSTAAVTRHVVDRTDSAGTQGSSEADAIAKQAAAAWRSGRAQDGAGNHVPNTSSTAYNGGRSAGSTARRLGCDLSSNSRRQSGRVLHHSSSMATSVNIRSSLAVREKRVVQASKDPLCFSRRPRRRSTVGSSHTASALRNVTASAAAAPEDTNTHLMSIFPQNRSISPHFRHSVAAVSSHDVPVSIAVDRGPRAPFPAVPVSDYALTWLSKVRLSEGEAAPPTQRTSDTVLAARGRDASCEHDQDNLASAFPSAGHSSSGHSSAAGVGNHHLWGAGSGAVAGPSRSPQCGHSTRVTDLKPVAFGSSHIPPHINASTDAQMLRTASFGCQVGSHMMACESGPQMCSVGVAVGRSVTGSLVSGSVPSIPASSAAQSPIGHPLNALHPTLSSQSSLFPPPAPAPSNASNMHAQNALAKRTSAGTGGAWSDVTAPTASMSPRGSRSHTRASSPSIHHAGSGAMSSRRGTSSTVYASMRSDTFAGESVSHDDIDATRHSGSVLPGNAMLCATCAAGMHELGLTVGSSSIHQQSGFQHTLGHSQCQNCGVAIDAEQVSDRPGRERCSDQLPLLSAESSQRSVSDRERCTRRSGGVPAKNVVQASIDSVRTSYGFVALGALAERCLRTSGGSLRGMRRSNRSMPQVFHSSDSSSVSDSHANAPRGNLSCSMDCSVSIGNPRSSAATTAAVRATAGRTHVAQGSPELPGATSVRSTAGSTSVTLALLHDTSPSVTGNGVQRDTAELAAGIESAPNGASIELCNTGMLSSAAAAPTAVLGDSWWDRRQVTAPLDGAHDVAEVHRSTPCLSLEPMSPCKSPDVQPHSAGATVHGPRKQRWRSTS